ncbi:MAG: Ig-like domain-containing protein [Myxococcales bacterium]
MATAYQVPLRVRVTDSNGFPVSGVLVHFSAPTSGATAQFSSSSVPTDTTGYAQTTATASTTVGTFQVLAEVSSVASPARFTLSNIAGPPRDIRVVSGNGQSVQVGAAFADLVVGVRDEFGNPVPNVAVSIAAQHGTNGATALLSGSTVTTSPTGQASVHATANDKVGTFTVSSTVGGFTALFNLTNTVGNPNTIVASFSSTAGTPSGDVVLLYGSLELGRATLVTGTATATGTVPTEPGDYTLTARFLGTATYTSSQSAPVTITVMGAADAGADARSDASTLDSGRDATSDATTVDTGVDTGIPDTGTLDASRVDSGATPDGSTMVDSGTGTDASSPPTPSAGAGGGCQTGPQPTSSGSLALLALGLIGVVRSRRK